MSNPIISRVLDGVRTSYGANRQAGSDLYKSHETFWLIQQKGSAYAKSALGKEVKALKKELYDGLKVIKAETGRNINPSKIWKDICNYGMEAAGIAPPVSNKVTTDGERDEQVWITEHLLVVYKHIMKLDTDEFSGIADKLGDIITDDLGGDLPE